MWNDGRGNAPALRPISLHQGQRKASRPGPFREPRDRPAARGGSVVSVLMPHSSDDLGPRVQVLGGPRPAFGEAALPPHSVEWGFPDRALLGGGAAMLVVGAQVAKIGPAASNVLITGESGTGK